MEGVGMAHLVLRSTLYGHVRVTLFEATPAPTSRLVQCQQIAKQQHRGSAPDPEVLRGMTLRSPMDPSRSSSGPRQESPLIVFDNQEAQMHHRYTVGPGYPLAACSSAPLLPFHQFMLVRCALQPGRCALIAAPRRTGGQPPAPFPRRPGYPCLC